MNSPSQGFSLIELITVMLLVGVLSVTLFSRLDSSGVASIQSSRDDVIAALFFAQQQAMMRPNITLETTPNSVSVRENGSPIQLTSAYYPLAMPAGVSLSSVALAYDKLGRTTATTITLTGSGNSAGVAASIRVEATGYAFAQ